jgi:hypothetical protein
VAKVSGPLFSMDARNKLGDALVFIGWKGIKDVRMWLKPTQPRTGKQGDVRLILGGLGRACKPADTTKYYVSEAKKVAPAQQSWISRFVQYIRTTYMATAEDFEAEYDEYNGHTQKAAFDNAAAALGLTDFDIAYKSTTSVFSAGLQLYELAKYAIDVHKANSDVFNKTPYTKALSQWTADDVTTLKNDLTTTAP